MDSQVTAGKVVTGFYTGAATLKKPSGAGDGIQRSSD